MSLFDERWLIVCFYDCGDSAFIEYRWKCIPCFNFLFSDEGWHFSLTTFASQLLHGLISHFMISCVNNCRYLFLLQWLLWLCQSHCCHPVDNFINARTFFLCHWLPFNVITILRSEANLVARRHGSRLSLYWYYIWSRWFSDNILLNATGNPFLIFSEKCW